jgi:hypothetical protein
MHSPQQAFKAFQAPQAVQAQAKKSKENPAPRWLVHRPGYFSQYVFGSPIF